MTIHEKLRDEDVKYVLLLGEHLKEQGVRTEEEYKNSFIVVADNTIEQIENNSKQKVDSDLQEDEKKTADLQGFVRDAKKSDLERSRPTLSRGVKIDQVQKQIGQKMKATSKKIKKEIENIEKEIKNENELDEIGKAKLTAKGLARAGEFVRTKTRTELARQAKITKEHSEKENNNSIQQGANKVVSDIAKLLMPERWVKHADKAEIKRQNLQQGISNVKSIIESLKKQDIKTKNIGQDNQQLNVLSKDIRDAKNKDFSMPKKPF